jgi:hypothetical protein
MYGRTSYAAPLEYAPDFFPSLGSRSIQRSLNARVISDSDRIGGFHL